jgi:hypothetical protein
MKNFLVSIDTEGDNLWKWCLGKPITTENAKYLPRFQELCEKYGFKPTYLTNYEMAKDPFFASYFKKKSDGRIYAFEKCRLHSFKCLFSCGMGCEKFSQVL